MLPLFAADEMRALDRRAITELGIPGATLMENAGLGAAEVVWRFVRDVSRDVPASHREPSLPRARSARRASGTAARPDTAPVVIVCGKGGNAGDGFVVARELERRRVPVDVLLTAPESDIRGDAGSKLAALRRTGLRPVLIEDDAVAVPRLARAAIVVDALLGTGARGAPTGLVARMIEHINASGRPVVALDIPSGASADGDPLSGPAIHAAVTVTFAGLKRGLVMGPGVGLAGRIEVVGIGVPDAEVGRGITTFLLEASDVAAHFPPRPREAHKGDYGRLLVIAGSVGKTGAAALTARAAMRSGAGLVTVASPESQQPIVASLVLEAMTEPVPETPARTAALRALAPLEALGRDRDAVAIGPGLGLDAETTELARTLVRNLTVPVVIDADALSAVAASVGVLEEARGPRCLTPHPGEMGRLVGASTSEIQRDRIAVARDFAARHRVHILLKGATTVIAAPDGRVVLNPTGNPGMASGGTGDVLTGMVGAFLARGMAPEVALHCAAFLHGRAGDLAAARLGQEALIASDLIDALPDAFRSLVPGAAPSA